ncbi:MAG: Tfp pilus assembly protein PilF, partial [Symploca sp. SIO1A3]|nr:Tfp pilus assembly protein PilF [Symploca sp. SIO1A3]
YAIKQYEAAIVLRRRFADPLGEANTRNNLGDAYRAANLPDDAAIAYGLALLLARTTSDAPNQFRAFRGLVNSYREAGNYPPAFRALDQHIALAKEEKDLFQELVWLRLSAELYTVTGDFTNARNFYQRAIDLARILEDTGEEALLRNDLAQVLYQD